ncbi:MAG: hypothetical protein GX820_01550 [Bacteroidales bacterium]|nr:hypothetical protein [Bacteroidales bacterium]
MRKLDDCVKKNFEGIEYLTVNELLYVRGGNNNRPPTRPIDIIELDKV